MTDFPTTGIEKMVVPPLWVVAAPPEGASATEPKPKTESKIVMAQN